MSDEEIRMRCLELAASLRINENLDGIMGIADVLIIFVKENPKSSEIKWEKINPDREV